MQTIKEKLESLSSEERKQLMYAFEHEICQYISLPDGTYIGVYCDKLKHLHPNSQTGVWSIGVDKCKISHF